MKKESNSNSMVVMARYVNVKTISKYTSLAESTIYEWAAQGRMPSIKIGRRVLFDLNDIDILMASLKRTNNQDEYVVNKIVGGINSNGI